MTPVQKLYMRIPRWVPLKLIASINLAGFVFTLLAAVFWFSGKESETQARLLEEAIASHAILDPAIDRIRQKNSELLAILASEHSTPEPQDLHEVLVLLERHAAQSGIKNARFIPDASTLVHASTVRIDGIGAGSSEAFRMFFVWANRQAWIVDVGAFSLTAASPEPGFTIELVARFTTGYSGEALMKELQ